MLALSYKDYTAEVDFDWLDLRWVGRVVNSDGAARVHGATVDEAEREFHKVVDHYLEERTERKPELEAIY